MNKLEELIKKASLGDEETYRVLTKELIRKGYGPKFEKEIYEVREYVESLNTDGTRYLDLFNKWSYTKETWERKRFLKSRKRFVTSLGIKKIVFRKYCLLEIEDLGEVNR